MNDTPETPSSMLEAEVTTNTTEAAETGPVPDPAPVPSEPPTEASEGDAQAAPDEGPVEPPAPITLEDLALPEGLELPEELGTKFLDLLNGKMSAADRANGLLNLYAEQTKTAVQGAADEYARQWTELETAWKGEIQKAYPGPKLQAAQSQIAKVLDQYGSKEVREAFTATGAGNNPHVFAFLHKIAMDVAERPPVQGSPTNGAPLGLAERLYGNKGNDQ